MGDLPAVQRARHLDERAQPALGRESQNQTGSHVATHDRAHIDAIGCRARDTRRRPHLRQVDGDDRAAELARMMGGSGESAAGLEHAVELLAKAGRPA